MPTVSAQQVLQQALLLAENILLVFSSDEQRFEKMRRSFGEDCDSSISLDLLADWRAAKFKSIPPVQVLKASVMNGASGAYSTETGEIYLADAFLLKHQDRIEVIAATLLEELGHHLDGLLNVGDTPGDEGAVFSAVVRGSDLSDDVLVSMAEEDDRGLIVVDGRTLTVEQQDFVGDEGNNTLVGTAEDDSLLGLGGNDTIRGGEGNDVLDGGDGDDSLYADSGVDTLIGGTGTDFTSFDLSAETTDITVEYSDINNGSITNGAKDGTTLQEIERVTLTSGSGDDTIDLSATNYPSPLAWSANVSSGAGDDTVVGGTGRDILRGEEGNDELFGEEGTDRIEGGAGNDLLDGGDGNDELYSDAGVDTIIGGEGTADFTLFELSEETADITVEYSDVNDGSITGGAKDGTTFREVERVTVNSGSGNDTIDLSATSYPFAWSANVLGGAGDDTVVGGTGRDILRGEEGNDIIRGGAGNADQLYGDAGNDELYGEDGDDRIEGGAGNDLLDGGDGNDDLYSDAGVDTIIGGEGTADFTLFELSEETADITVEYSDVNDGSITGGAKDGTTFREVERVTVNSGSGNDTIDLSATSYPFAWSANVLGGAGDDTVVGGTGRDILRGEEGNDIIRGGAGNADQLYGDAGNDELYGEDGDDRIEGGDGNDVLDGGAGNDDLFGDNGNDVLVGVGANNASPGANERDTLTGGAGVDHFILGDTNWVGYDDRNITTSGTSDYALITDFNAAEDKIQLRGAAANYRLDVSPINNVSGTAIYLIKPGNEPDELIAVLQNATDVDLTSGTFEFVSTTNEFIFSQDAYTVNEDGTASITVFRNGDTNGEVSVTLSLGNGTATAPEDYDNTPILLTFSDGETTQSVTVPIVDDVQFEAAETVNLGLTNPTGGFSIGALSAATLTITDDDTPIPGILAFSRSTFTVNEDGTPVIAVTLTRTNGSDGEVGVTISLTDGTATSGDDYTNTPLAVTFADGETIQTVEIPIIDDAIYDEGETINLTLGEPTGGASLGAATTATLTIVDNDAAAGTFTFSDTAYSVTEAGVPITEVTVNRAEGSDGPVSVTIALTDITATRPEDYLNSAVTVNFANGETSKTVAVPIVDDGVFEESELLTLTISSVTGGAAIGAQNTAALLIVDDDGAAGSLAFETANFSMNEDGTPISEVVVVRTGGSNGEVGATITLQAGTATSPADYNNQGKRKKKSTKVCIVAG